nr:MAG TPA: brazzein [Caudoviricetes sp.]
MKPTKIKRITNRMAHGNVGFSFCALFTSSNMEQMKRRNLL